MSVPPLLTAYIFFEQLPEMNTEPYQNWLKTFTDNEITIKILTTNDQVFLSTSKDPHVYLTVGQKWNNFPWLSQQPYTETLKWVHVQQFQEITPQMVYRIHLHATDPMPTTKVVQPTLFAQKEPLISVFTASYRSGEMIKRPLMSLLQQTYKHWEWVIVDDSGDDDQTYQQTLAPLINKDPRIYVYRQTERSGYIGTVKRAAAGLCTGEILVEVDHDDNLTPDCLEKIVKAFQNHPECGFACGYSSELYEDYQPHWYGLDAGFGYLVYWRQQIKWLKRWENVARTSILNSYTIRHLVGLPNHPRAWTRDCYYLVGGHRPGLSIADDYDLMVRTFLSTNFVVIPHLLYLQYRNHSGNQTFQRNHQIQIMCQMIYNYYAPRIQQRVTDLGLPILDNHVDRIWTHPPSPYWQTKQVIDYDHDKLSLIVPIMEDNQETKEQIQTLITKGHHEHWNNLELIIVGQLDKIDLETTSQTIPEGKIRWWSLAGSLEDYLRWGLMIRSGQKVEIMWPKDMTQEQKQQKLEQCPTF